ncbi:hypothetical protein KCP77_05365 [Salmonella enterica subsp. enterica]|nr:hypothetical protein KCP77_05365 [Salmonella enterica subsp. enterica]
MMPYLHRQLPNIWALASLLGLISGHGALRCKCQSASQRTGKGESATLTKNPFRVRY